MNYLADLLHRATTGRGLTTREAAALQAIKGALIGFLAPLLPYFVPVITGQEHLVWSAEAFSSLLGAFIAFVLRLYFSQNDPEIAALMETYYQAKQKSFLDQSLAPGPGAIQFTVPIVKPVAQATTPIHEMNTAPTLQAVAPPVPTIPAMPSIQNLQQ